MAKGVNLTVYTGLVTGWVFSTHPSPDKPEIRVVGTHKVCGRRISALILQAEVERSADPEAWLQASIVLGVGRHEHECQGEDLLLWNEW